MFVKSGDTNNPRHTKLRRTFGVVFDSVFSRLDFEYNKIPKQTHFMSSSRRFVMLRSSDDHEFVLPLEAAIQSRMISDFIQGVDALTAGTSEEDANGGSGWSSSSNNVLTAFSEMTEIPLKEISSPVLQLVCHYLVEKESGRNTMSDFRALQSMDPHSEADKQLVLELLLAADYLDC